VLSTRTISRLAKVTGRRLSPALPVREADVAGTPPRPGPTDVPVLGHARSGQDGMFFDNGVVDSYVPRLHFLSGVGSAYALYMNSDSQEPVFRLGDLLYVNPVIPPRIGDDIVIELQNGEAYIKRLLRRTAGQLTAQQFNPACELEFAASDIANVHLVVAVIKVRT
jgi:phage repressor protein C with HTH and peptisase S24 domain